MNDINTINSIKTNFLSWIMIFICVSIVSYPFVSAGFLTFFFLMIYAYFVHKHSHDFRNIATILHHYHHENNNFFSHFSQIILELSFGILIIPCYYYLGENFVNIWSAILFILFYSTVHNINYGQLRVNDVHYLHHKYIYTNIGPDICDVMFGTKNPQDTEVENTNHYIPNLVLLSVLILIVKYLCEDDYIRFGFVNTSYIVLSIFAVFILISSTYLYCTYEKPIESENEKEETK